MGANGTFALDPGNSQTYIFRVTLPVRRVVLRVNAASEFRASLEGLLEGTIGIEIAKIVSRRVLGAEAGTTGEAGAEFDVYIFEPGLVIEQVDS